MSTTAQVTLNVLTILAIIAGPVLAIQVQKYLDKTREQKRRKVAVFRELMVTRSSVLSPRHVEALNAIQMEFSPDISGEKRVLDAWQLYINHLGSKDFPDAATWAAQGPELLADLLLEMATSLHYNGFNKAKIKAEGYIPQYFVDVEREHNELRRAAVDVFEGRRPLRVQLTGEEETGVAKQGGVSGRTPDIR